MSAPMPAARAPGGGGAGDLVEHNAAHAFRFAAFAGWSLTGGTLIKGAAILVFGVTPMGFLALTAAFTLEWVAGELLEIGAFKLGEQLTFGGMDGVKTGSDNVFVNKQPSARGAKKDEVKCCAGKKILGGSKWVGINQKPAARYNDWLDHSGKISTGSEDTLIGGPTTDVPEKWEWQDTIKYLNITRELAQSGAKALAGRGARINPGLMEFGEQGMKTSLHEMYDRAKPLDSLWESVR